MSTNSAVLRGARWLASVTSAGWDEVRRGHIPDPSVLAFVLHVASGLTVLLTVPLVSSFASTAAVTLIAVAVVAIGVVIPALPWHRWAPDAHKWLVPEALALVVAFNLAGREPFLFALFYLIVWVWVGLTQPRGAALRWSPLLALAYVVPALLMVDDAPAALVSVAFVVPVAVVMGETIAFVAENLRESRVAVERSHARYAALVRHAAEFVFVLDGEGQIAFANEAVGGILGWAPDDLVGRSPRRLLHPDDVDSVLEWYARTSAGETEPIEIRCLHADGSWRWIEGIVQDLSHVDGVNGIVVNGRDISERRVAEAALEHAAYTDALTGLMNRAALQRDLQELLATGRPSAAVLYLDLDGFKVINDSLGHPTGDALLRAVAHRLRATTSGRLCRIGGDEFVVVITDAGIEGAVEAAAGAVVSSFARPFQVDGRALQIGASVGVAVAEPGMTVADLLRAADLAMYRAKHDGGARWACFDEAMARRAQRRLDVEQELRVALEQDQLIVEFQPEIDVELARVCGAEALVRWIHPERGRIAPDEFIGVAEETGLIHALGEQVLEAACAAAATLSRAGHDLVVAVNMSAHQLGRPGLVDVVDDALDRWGLRADRLRIEITETSLVLGDLARTAIPALRGRGVSIAVDDFGTGYSSLSKLESFTIDTLKIDKSFVQSASGEPSPLIGSIVNMAHDLGLGVVAEGVETAAQLAMLRQLGCTHVQGFLFARSMPIDDLTAMLDAGSLVALHDRPAAECQRIEATIRHH